MDPIMMRGIERILAVAVGGLTVYLGYRLFHSIPTQTDAEGKVVLPGGTSIYLTRIGPGAFFALFGTLVLALSFYFSITYADPAPPQIGGNRTRTPSEMADPVQTPGKHFVGVSPLSDLEIESEMYFLNYTFPRKLIKAELSDKERNDTDVHIEKLKLLVMYRVWRDEWGKFEEFEEWVQQGANAPPSNNAMNEAADFYRYGEEPQP